MAKHTLYLVDDDEGQLALLTAQLERSGTFATEAFTDAEALLARVESDPPDGVVSDLKMPGLDGLELTRRLREMYPLLPVIVATGAGSTDDATACFEAGATDFVTKPVNPANLIARVRKAVDDVPARELIVEAAQARFDPHGIIGMHPRVDAVRRFVEVVASAPGATVLLLGESGTGKNLVARAVHAAGSTARLRFVEVNCAALPAQLLEAELFGYEKGAFTDARQTKKGLVEEADGGTLFLDEIGSMPLELQAKLLTFLESRSFRRIGATTARSVDVRVVAATNTDLPAQVRGGAFREDLYYRLNVASHTLPPLREIPSDIEALARHFAKRAAEYFRKPEPRITPESVRLLERHDWPGNARELRNTVERALIFSTGSVLDVATAMHPGSGPAAEAGGSAGGRASVVATAGTPAGPGVGENGGADAGTGSPGAVVLPPGLTLEEAERRYIVRTLEHLEGRVGEAAERLGMTRKAFWAKRKRLGLV